MIQVKLKYTTIKTDEQYDAYCDILWDLIHHEDADINPEKMDEIDLLTLLIDNYQEEILPTREIDPVELIKLLMDDHHLKSKDLAGILGVSKGLVSSILHYRRGLSKKNVRILASHFKLQEEALSKPYKLKGG